MIHEIVNINEYSFKFITPIESNSIFLIIKKLFDNKTM